MKLRNVLGTGLVLLALGGAGCSSIPVVKDIPFVNDIPIGKPKEEMYKEAIIDQVIETAKEYNPFTNPITKYASIVGFSYYLGTRRGRKNRV
jgi:hypothetical protein